jgi:phenylacetate-CoA ligase
MYAAFVKHVSLPFYEWRRGTDLLKLMRDFERSQWLPPEKLQAMQWDKLKKLLSHAYQHVPLYREKFKAIGAVPEDFRSLDDFARFPTLVKKEIQERLDDLIAATADPQNLLRGITSGSSGQPTMYVQERSSNRARVAAGKRLTRIAGWDFGLRLFYLWRDSPFIIEGDKISAATPQAQQDGSAWERLRKAINERFGVANPTIRVDPTLMSDAEMARMFARLERFKPDVIISYVNTLYRFAQYLDAEKLNAIRPRSVIVSSESLYPHQRELMEKVFGCRVYNRYGLSETGIVAIECENRDGLHINQEILHIEYVPTVTGNLQIVVTDLINQSMPILRYETGDTGRPVEGTCPCGRGLARIGNLEGRVIDILPSKVCGHVNGQLFATFHWIQGVKQYQVIQEKIDAFRINIVRTEAFRDENLEPMAATIREKFGADARIQVDFLERIPFTSGGKYKLVVSEVEAGAD